VNGALAVVRYSLVELTRRRILIVFFAVGAVGIVGIAALLKVFTTALTGNVSFGSSGSDLDPATLDRALELGFVSDIISVLGIFALLIAFGIGMTVIYHDLESGAAISIFSKPVSRAAFTAGKVAAAIVAMVAIVGVLSLEARLVMFLFGTGDLGPALWWETVAQVANAVTLMLLVMALSTWMNNIIAAVVAFIYNAVGGIVVALHAQDLAGGLGNNAVLKTGLDILYWLVPHELISDAPREIAKAEFALVAASSRGGGPTADQFLSSIPSASGATDIIWWAFGIAVFASLVYLAVRRRQV
jgi:ABC-type transport system involved in multi-copper enzyme maturation permease subunit